MIGIIKKIIGSFLEIFYRITQNYGLSIVLLTIVVKVATTPLIISQKKQMKRNSELAPEMKRIREKYKDNKEKMTEEITAFYKNQKFNPLSGCLTAILQPIIIISLYCVIKKPITYIMGVNERDNTKIIEASTYWAGEQIRNGSTTMQIEMLRGINKTNFGTKEIEISKQLFLHPEILDNSVIDENLKKNVTLINFNFLGFDLSESPNLDALPKFFTLQFRNHSSEIFLLLIPLFSALTTHVVNVQTMKDQKRNSHTDTKEGSVEEFNAMSNKGLILLAPIMSAFFTFSCPAGIGIYWITSNIFQIVQQHLIGKFLQSKEKSVVIEDKCS